MSKTARIDNLVSELIESLKCSNFQSMNDYNAWADGVCTCYDIEDDAAELALFRLALAYREHASYGAEATMAATLLEGCIQKKTEAAGESR